MLTSSAPVGVGQFMASALYPAVALAGDPVAVVGSAVASGSVTVGTRQVQHYPDELGTYELSGAAPFGFYS